MSNRGERFLSENMPLATQISHQTRGYTAAGFAVLRTPLLSVDVFNAWTRQLLSRSQDHDLGLSEDERLELLRPYASIPAFVEGIRIASPALYRE